MGSEGHRASLLTPISCHTLAGHGEDSGDSDLLAGRYFEDKLSFWFVATSLMRPLGASIDSNTQTSNYKKLRLTSFAAENKVFTCTCKSMPVTECPREL